MPRLTIYPLGNADTLLMDLRNGRKLLFDFADMRNAADPADKCCDLPAELRADLRAAGRDYYDVVAFTHLDADHVQGASEFFVLEHAQKYGGPGRTKIEELWVPAAALTEVGAEDCARAIRQEARHRMRRGWGVRVFSRPEALRSWFEQERINIESRRHLITDAGQLIPGFNKADAGGVEFFVHSPFGWRHDERGVEDRNQDCLVLQATFSEGGRDVRALLMSDLPWDGIDQVVQTTKRHGREGRLWWDFMKVAHHCSYLSLAADKGQDETVPTDDVRWLLESAGQRGAVLVSSSWPIPMAGSAEDRNAQPPHRQAANYYRSVRRLLGGEFEITMERPALRPRPTVVDITSRGVRLLSNSVAPVAAIAATPMRAG